MTRPAPALDAQNRPRPTHQGWISIGEVVAGIAGYRCEEGPYVVTATAGLMFDPKEGGWTWTVSISVRHRRRGPERAGSHHVRKALEAFGMTEAREDNHGPMKFVRTFWLQLDPAERKECGCAEEPPEVSIAGHGQHAEAYLWRPA